MRDTADLPDGFVAIGDDHSTGTQDGTRNNKLLLEMGAAAVGNGADRAARARFACAGSHSVAGPEGRTYKPAPDRGEVPEWSIGAVSKSVTGSVEIQQIGSFKQLVGAQRAHMEHGTSCP